MNLAMQHQLSDFVSSDTWNLDGKSSINRSWVCIRKDPDEVPGFLGSPATCSRSSLHWPGTSARRSSFATSAHPERSESVAHPSPLFSILHHHRNHVARGRGLHP